MAGVLGMHEIELRDGVDPAEFERQFAVTTSMSELPGWRTRLLKGERGERAGKYLILFEIDSLEARDRFYPAEGEESEETKRFDAEHPDEAAAWERLYSFFRDVDVNTDYVPVAE